MKFNTIYNNIPDDIIPIIFEYYGKIKFRQGQLNIWFNAAPKSGKINSHSGFHHAVLCRY